MRAAFATTSPVQRSIDWAFRSRESGRIVIVQRPNLPLVLFVVLRVAAMVIPDGSMHDVVSWTARIALAWWGLDELLRGVNPFRRLLGAAALVSLFL
jgi:hypothetical protein